MGAGQREERVVKLCPEPGIHGVALFAGGGKACRDVTGDGGFLVILRMARITLSGESLKLSHRSSLVAGITIQSSVRADQRKTVLMIVDLLYGNLPALHRMALLTRSAKLALVNVRVTVGAFRSYVGENWLDVTLRASHSFVHAAQRETSLVVIKLRNIPDGLPSAQSMAVLAGDIQGTVRAARTGTPLRQGGQQGRTQQQPNPGTRSERGMHYVST